MWQGLKSWRSISRGENDKTAYVPNAIHVQEGEYFTAGYMMI